MTRKIRVRTHFDNSADQPESWESNNGKDLTIPDQTMSISTIIARTQKGLPVTGVKVPLYDPEGELPDFRRMDISEIHDLKERMRQAEANIRKQLNEKEQEEAEKQREEYYRKRFKAQEELKKTPPAKTEETPTP